MHNEPALLNVVRGADDVCLVAVGEIDMATAPVLAAALARLDVSNLVIDMARVTFIDSSGLHVLYTASRHGTVRLRSVRGNVRRTIELTGLDAVLAFDDDGA